jgi:tetratricopeptide (TPR) repeat protein
MRICQLSASPAGPAGLQWLPRLTLLVALLVLSPAGAQPDEATRQAKAHFPQALTLYKEAYKAKPLPAFLFNMGQCHRNMGQCDRALFFFKQYLVHKPDAPNKADVDKLIRICEAAVRNAQRKATAASAPPASAPLASAPPPKRGAAKRPTPRGQVSKPPSRGELSPIWFWSGVGISSALLITGTVTGVSALGKSNDYKSSTTSIPERRELKDSGETLRTVSTVTMIAGGVTAAATAALVFFTDWNRTTESAAAISAAPLPGGGTLVVGGRF